MNKFAEHTIQSGDRVVLTPALSICIYFGVLTEELRDSLASIWKSVLVVYREQLRWYMTECMPRQEPVDVDVLEMISFWFEPDTPTRRRYFYYSHGGSADTVSPWSVELYIENTQPIDESQRPMLSAIYGTEAEAIGKQANCFRLSFPASQNDVNYNQIFLLTKQIFETVPFLYGYAGFSLLFNADLNFAHEIPWKEIVRIAMRHPGYDIFQYNAMNRFVFDKVKTINWLTFLGEEFGEEFFHLGREAFLRSREIEIFHSGKKVMVKIGPSPQIGDLNSGETLPLYREVAEALDPLLCKEHWAFSRVFDADKTIKWIRRFSQNE